MPNLKLQFKFRREINVAARQLQSGGVVAFPTDTLYGLGADLFDESALERIFAIKGRASDQALPALLASREQLELVTDEFPPVGTRLAELFWPISHRCNYLFHSYQVFISSLSNVSWPKKVVSIVSEDSF